MEFSIENPNLSDWQICFAAQRPFPSINEKLTIGLPLLFLNIITTVSNIILIYYNIYFVLKTKAQQNNQVLILVNHFAAANIGYCIVNFIASIPSLLSPTIIYSTTVSQFFTASFNTHFYLTILFLNFLIGFERFIYFFELFSKNTVAIIRKKLPIAIWIFGFGCGFATEISGCNKRFNQWTMTYVFSCTACGAKGNVFQVSMLYSYWGLYSPIGLISLYVAVFVLIFKNKWKIGSSSNNGNNNQVFAKQEIKVAINFFVICCFQWFMSTMFFYAGSLFGKSSLLTPFVINIAGVCNGLTQPVALILLNIRARRQLWQRLKKHSNVIGTVSVVTVHQKNSSERRIT